jgi:predicted ATP-grasp superfamily ATP-dependent carboligase
MRIVIDSLDKRMTVPVIDALARSGCEVYGICFDADRPLNPKKLAMIHRVSRAEAAAGLKVVLSGYTADDILIAGNPGIIEAVNALRPDIRYLLPSQQDIEKASDKKELQNLAAALGIRTPKELSAPAFPMIAKLNVSENIQLKPAERYRIIRNDGELRAAEPFLTRFRDNLILQEYVDGPARGVAMLLDGASDLVDFIVYERLLEYPVTGGPSAACRSIVNPGLAQTAYRLLRGLNWKGMAMVEFKGDSLLEVNPRFWGSLPLLFVAKSAFFTNYIKILRHEQTIITPEDVLYRPNKKMVYFPQGLLAVLALLKMGKIGKAAAGIGTLFSGKEGIFRFSNPRPFLTYQRSLFLQKTRAK